jgi:hypothetical protein
LCHGERKTESKSQYYPEGRSDQNGGASEGDSDSGNDFDNCSLRAEKPQVNYSCDDGAQQNKTQDHPQKWIHPTLNQFIRQLERSEEYEDDVY